MKSNSVKIKNSKFENSKKILNLFLELLKLGIITKRVSF